MKAPQVLTLYSTCSRRTVAGAVATLETAWVAYQNSHGYRDNPIAIPLSVVAHVAGGVNSQIPDNQTTHTAPFDTVAHIDRSARWFSGYLNSRLLAEYIGKLG